MIKYLYFLIIIISFSSCGYAKRVKSLDDVTLCKNLGQYTLYKHNQGVLLTKNEILARNIDKDYCSSIANQTIDKLKLKLKLSLCQNLAAFNYQGDYVKFKRTLDDIQRLGFADEECTTMAEFYIIKIAREEERDQRKKEKYQAISNAIKSAAERMHQSNERLYGKGSYTNPIYIELK